MRHGGRQSDFRVFHSKALEVDTGIGAAERGAGGSSGRRRHADSGGRSSGISNKRAKRCVKFSEEAVRGFESAAKRTLRERVERMEQALEELLRSGQARRRATTPGAGERERAGSAPATRIQRRLGTRLQRAAGDRSRRGVDSDAGADPDAGRCGRALRANPGGRTPTRPTSRRGLLKSRRRRRRTSSGGVEGGGNWAALATRRTRFCVGGPWRISDRRRKRKYRQYQAKASDCRECAQRHKCCGGQDVEAQKTAELRFRQGLAFAAWSAGSWRALGAWGGPRAEGVGCGSVGTCAWRSRAADATIGRKGAVVRVGNDSSAGGQPLAHARGSGGARRSRSRQFERLRAWSEFRWTFGRVD